MIFSSIFSPPKSSLEAIELLILFGQSNIALFD